MSEADRDDLDGRTVGDPAVPTDAEPVASPSDMDYGPEPTDDDLELTDDEPELAESDDFDLVAAADADPRTKAELLGALIVAEGERDEFLDDLRRSHADFENYRKRVMRESASQREAGKAAVASALLDVLDDLDRTVAAAEASTDTALAKGVELVASKLLGALRGDGLERIEATGVPFDPTEHEAVQQLQAQEPNEAPLVVQVLRPGYRLGDKVLRAAMVVVEQ